MTKVVDINSRKPHQVGPAICLHCEHEWEATQLSGNIVFDCPECGMEKGIYRGLCEPAEGSLVFQCNCGNQRFFIVSGGAYCIGCGLVHPYEDLID